MCFRLEWGRITHRAQSKLGKSIEFMLALHTRKAGCINVNEKQESDCDQAVELMKGDTTARP